MGEPANDAVGELIFHNRYSYANGNPVNLTDPNGMQACIPGLNCSVPGDGGIFTSDCTLFPNAFGCPGYGSSPPIIPPNWGNVEYPFFQPPNYGDYTLEDLLQLCLLFNNGLCTVTIPDTTTGGIEAAIPSNWRRRLKQLSERCFIGDLSACNELRRLCMEARNIPEDIRNAACQALQGAYHGNCDPWTYEAIRAEQDRYCGLVTLLGGCETATSCNEVIVKKLFIDLCLAARTMISQRCYPNQGDVGHAEAIQNLAVASSRCAAKLVELGC